MTRDLLRPTASACAFATLLVSAPGVRAQEATAAPEPPFSLSWSAPEECPNEVALRAEVERLAPEAAVAVPGFSAKGTIVRGTGGFELVLETLHAERRGSRRMQDVSCTELTRAAAVVIALAIRPESAAPEPAATTPEAPAATPVAPVDITPPRAVPAPPTAPPRPTQAEPFPIELWLAGAFVAEVGTLPGFAPGVLVGAEGRTTWLRFGLSAEFLPTQRTNASQGEPSLAVDYLGGDAFGCLGLLERKFAPGACAGLGVGRLRGRSRDAPIPGEGSTLWVTPRIGAFLAYRALSRLTLEAGAHLRIPLKEASFTVENYGSVYETSAVAALFLLGAGVRIW
ncbi:MAG TPA: hypothetical protein VGK73_05870 [Polyangiaceae bacterium]